jgi:hypothetical protein
MTPIHDVLFEIAARLLRGDVLEIETHDGKRLRATADSLTLLPWGVTMFQSDAFEVAAQCVRLGVRVRAAA